MENIKLFEVADPSIAINDNTTKLKKEREYKAYLDTHISNVKRAFEEMVANNYLNNTYNGDIKLGLDELKFVIDGHDQSKYSDEEFDAYRRYFYPISEDEKNDAEDDFSEAWKHHYTVNDHHPEHWVIDGVPSDMSMRAILEMICDWQSFAYLGKSNASEFWFRNPEGREEKSKIMTDHTIETVERILSLINYKE